MAFIFCWPVGIVLTILRSISIPANTNKNNVRTANRADVKSSFERTESRNSSQQKKRGKGKNVSTATKVTRFFAIFLGILSLITTCSFAGTSSDLSFFLNDFLMGVCPMLIGSISCGIATKIFSDRDTRFGRIRAIIGNRESINLTKLAAASNEKLKNVRKDIQKMIDNGEFGEYAYIDLGTNNFMRSPYAEADEPEQFGIQLIIAVDICCHIDQRKALPCTFLTSILCVTQKGKCFRREKCLSLDERRKCRIMETL